MDRPEITTLDSGFVFESTARERIEAPNKKMLKFHALPMETTTQVDTFKTLPSGDANPNYGKDKTVLIFKGELDESGAKGQWYSAWVSPAISDRSKLGKISEALFGSFDAIKGKTAADVEGQPFQCALKWNKDETRQVLDLDKIMPADDSQTRVSADVVLTDIPDAPISDEELEAAFGGK